MTPDAIRTLRRSQKLTQAGFGALLGTSQSVVSDWERGRSKPRGIALNAIKLAQLAQELADDLECIEHGHTWSELCAAPSEPALVMWRKFVRERSQP